MSAWIVSKPHIDRLVTAIIFGTSDHPVQTETLLERADAFGQCLLNENVKSVKYRYGDDRENLPGPIERYYDEPYRFEKKPLNTSTEIIKAIHCLEYQSCEHREWEDSMARAMLERLENHLLALRGRPVDRGLGGEYDNAPWGFDA